MFWWGAYTQFQASIEDRLLRWFISIARGAGYILNLNTALVILLAARLFFTWIRDTPLAYILPLDKSFPSIHIIVGYVIAGTVVVHAVFHSIWIIWFNGWVPGLWGFTMSFVTGWVLLVIFATMLFFARPSVRKNNFPLFYRVHLIGGTLFFLILIFHGMYNMRPETYKYITPALIIYLIDRLVRRFKSKTASLQLSASNSVFKDKSVLELRIPKPFNYRSGQYAEIRVPEINREWHPFTIASAAHEESMCFYIKNLGDWTNALHEHFQKRLNEEITEPLEVRVRGPFGAPCQHVDGYQKVVLISGGIGATPFSAVCKDLHHLQQKECPSPQQCGGEYHLDQGHRTVDQRIHKAISDLYDVDIEKLSHIDENEQEKGRYVADLIRLSTFNRRSADTSSSSASQSNDADSRASGYDSDGKRSEATSTSYMTGDTVSSIADSKIDVTPPARKHTPMRGNGDSFFNDPYKRRSLTHQGKARQKMAHIADLRSRLLGFLHTTRVQFILLASMIARIVVISVASIMKSDFVRLHSSTVEVAQGKWVVYADFGIGLFATLILPLTILLEISFMGTRFFSTNVRCFEFFVFLPLNILCATLEIRTLVSSTPPEAFLIFLHYVIFLPIVFVLLSFRMYRSIGSRRLLTSEKNTCVSKRGVPDVDFVWTTPYSADDMWLRSELEPLASGTALRLHRYVTREKDVDVEEGGSLTTNTREGRPEWDEFFQEIASSSPSNSDIGVFFCGPHAMGKSIKKSLRKVEVVSNLRGAYLRGTKRRTVVEDLGLASRREVGKLRERGCAVRFVFREENFG